LEEAMTNPPAHAGDPTPTDAVAGALALLRDAEDAAGRTRAEAERYARQRQNEADLLVAKARRLLVAAEEKAGVIVAVAHSEARQVIDLDALAASSMLGLGQVVAPGATTLSGGKTRLDSMLAAAISNAVDHAFHGQTTA
jgi:hypothetical protein